MNEEQKTGQEAQVEENTTPVMPDQNKPAESSQEASKEQDQLPEEVSERTRKEFEKLKEHNKQLSEKVSQYERTNIPSVLDSLNPQSEYAPQASQYQNLSQQQVDQVASQFVDSEGFVNIQAVETALSKANKEASEANTKYQQLEQRVTRYEHDSQTKVAHEKHPYLDPANSEFDPKFYDLVKNELIGQMMKGEQDLMKAANKVKDFYNPADKAIQAEEAATQKKNQTVAQRTQATAIPSPSRDSSPQEQADLVVGTLKGDRESLYKRLRASGY